MNATNTVPVTDPRQNAECLALLADLRTLAERAEDLRDRCDRGGVVISLWGVCDGLRRAKAWAEIAISEVAE